jgi:hypothetical protein
MCIIAVDMTKISFNISIFMMKKFEKKSLKLFQKSSNFFLQKMSINQFFFWQRYKNFSKAPKVQIIIIHFIMAIILA